MGEGRSDRGHGAEVGPDEVAVAKVADEGCVVEGGLGGVAAVEALEPADLVAFWDEGFEGGGAAEGVVFGGDLGHGTVRGGGGLDVVIWALVMMGLLLLLLPGRQGFSLLLEA